MMSCEKELSKYVSRFVQLKEVSRYLLLINLLLLLTSYFLLTRNLSKNV